MTSETAEDDAVSWYSDSQTAFKANYEAGAKPEPQNEDILLSYYLQGGIASASDSVEWSFDTTHEKEYTLTLVCIDTDETESEKSIDYTA